MLIILFKRRGKNILTKSFDSDFWFLTISIALTFATIALLAFDTYIRYMFFIHPLMVLLGVIFFTTLFTKIFCKNPQFINFSGHLILLVSICASFNSVFLRKSSMLYNNEYHNMETLKAFSNCRGIFLVKNNSAPALTQECRAVMQIKEVYCTEPSELKNLQKSVTQPYKT